MFRALLVLILVCVLGFAAYVASLPSEFSVTRSTVISAPPEAVFPHVNSLKKWDAWSPWAKRDPNSKTEYSGPESGVGAKFTWSGNDEVGVGEMTITDSAPNELVGLNLKIIEPFPGENPVSLKLTPEGDGTRVTWTISGDQPFVERAILVAMQMDMETMIGADYETGLASLKKVAEADVAAQRAAAAAKAEAAAKVAAEKAAADAKAEAEAKDRKSVV